jgi:hypothetical protein
MLSSSLTNYEAAGAPMSIDSAELQNTFLLCDLDTSEVFGPTFVFNRGITLVIVDDIVLEAARFVSNGTKPPGVTTHIDGFVSTTVEVRGLLYAVPQIDKAKVIISEKFTPNGIPVPKGFAVSSLAASWLLPIVDIGMTKLRDSGQMSKLLSTYIPPIFEPTRSTVVDVTNFTFDALWICSSILLFCWISAILYSKRVRYQWKQKRLAMFTGDVYSYIADENYEEHKPTPSSLQFNASFPSRYQASHDPIKRTDDTLSRPKDAQNSASFPHTSSHSPVFHGAKSQDLFKPIDGSKSQDVVVEMDAIEATKPAAPRLRIYPSMGTASKAEMVTSIKNSRTAQSWTTDRYGGDGSEVDISHQQHHQVKNSNVETGLERRPTKSAQPFPKRGEIPQAWLRKMNGK